jgi:OOP family OmpA-OmpF porin
MIKKIKLLSMSLLVLGCISSAYAVREGIYVGFMGGTAKLHNTTTTVTNGSGVTAQATPSSSNNFGVRLFFGYNFNQYGAIEAGYTKFGPTKYTVSAPLTNLNPQTNEQAADIVGKGILALPYFGINGFVKAGVAYIDMKYGGSFNQRRVPSFKPVGAVGIGYDLTQNWVVDFSFTRIFSNGSTPNADLLAFGISYHWVQKYCGQFLC